MIALIPISVLLLIHQSSGSADADLKHLLKKHPTWSFEATSVKEYIKDAARNLKAVDPTLTEKVLWVKMNRTLGRGQTHIVRKVGDPKWITDPEKIPSTFDAREHWKSCADLIGDLDDEGPCHTEGPAVVASVMSDRHCIYTNGASKDRLSTEMLASCAEMCTRQVNIIRSWKYALSDGIPTGGPYHSHKGCLPYDQGPCIHNNVSTSFPSRSRKFSQSKVSHQNRPSKLKPCSDEWTWDHECPTKCSNKEYSTPLDKDRKKITTYYLMFGNEFHIRNEILWYGPVATSIILYDDFFNRPSGGFYQRSADSKFVAWDKYFKIIGWGEENGMKYWLAVNGWTSWGDKVFKIPRGSNHVYVEYILYGAVFDDIN